MKTCVVV